MDGRRNIQYWTANDKLKQRDQSMQLLLFHLNYRQFTEVGLEMNCKTKFELQYKRSTYLVFRELQYIEVLSSLRSQISLI